jgi:hypothetical protein
MRAPLGFADAEGLFLTIVSHRQMVDAGEQRAELLAVVDDAADGNASEADPMISAFATDQTYARGVALDVMVGKRDLERGVDCFRTGVAEKYVIEVSRGERGNPARKLERLGMAELECRRVVQRGRLALDRFDDRFAIMAGICAPQAGRAVERACVRRWRCNAYPWRPRSSAGAF